MAEIDLYQFNEDCIEQHNFLRGLHGCPSISYDPVIAENAQAYAEELAARDVMEHSEDIPYGENLAVCNKGANGTYSGYEVSNSWYSEIEDYDFNAGQEQMECGHFSQLVWREAIRAGFGYAKNPNTFSIYVVGQYDPPGNFSGQWGENIPAPLNGAIWRPPPVTDRDVSLDLKEPELDFGFNENFEFESSTKSDRQSKHEYENYPKIILPDNRLEFNEEDFREDVLDIHNDLRRRHGAKALKRNADLDKRAQEWAESLYSSGLFLRNNFEYRDGPIGDNITVLIRNTDMNNPKRFVENWYDEGKAYDYDLEPRTINDIRNFSQIIWEDTKELGCGAVGDNTGRTCVVCFYWPAGNIRGQFLNNLSERKY